MTDEAACSPSEIHGETRADAAEDGAKTSLWRARSALWRRMARHALPSLLLNAVAPIVLYSLLRPHMTVTAALLLTALIPLAENAVALARHRRLDAFGVLVFCSLVGSGAVVLLGGNPRWILARESLLSGAFGLLMLLSLLFRRPLVYYLAGHFVAGHAPERVAAYRRTSRTPRTHSFLRLMTAVWGMTTMADAALNVYLAFVLPVTTFLTLAPTLRYTLLAVTFAWSVAHAHRGRHLVALFGTTS